MNNYKNVYFALCHASCHQVLHIFACPWNQKEHMRDDVLMKVENPSPDYLIRSENLIVRSVIYLRPLTVFFLAS